MYAGELGWRDGYGILLKEATESLLGVLAFIAAQVVVLVACVVITSHAHAWPAIGHVFATVSAAGLTGLLAALAVMLLTGGHATMRRVTV
jgi:hypothetical protein